MAPATKKDARLMRPVLTIRLKLLFLVVLASLPALGLVLVSGILAERQALRKAETEATHISRDLALRQQQLTASTRQFLATLCQLPSVRGLDGKSCAPLFRELLTANPVYSDIILSNAQGQALASAHGATAQINIGGTAYFQELLKTGAFTISGYRKSVSTGLDVIVCAYPVLNAEGKVLGAVSTGVRLNIFDDIVRDIQLPFGSTIYLADRAGLRLFNRHFPDPKPDVYPLGKPIRPNVWRRALSEPRGDPFYDTGADGQHRLYVVQESRLRQEEKPYLYVGVSLPESAILEQARKSMRAGLGLLGLAAVLAGMGAWLVGKKVFAERIERLARVAVSFAEGDFSARTNLLPPRLSAEPDELGRLGLAVDRIGEELSRRDAEREATLKRLARTQFAVDHAGEEIYWTDESGRFQYVNERAAKNLGYTMDELLALDVAEVDPDHTATSWAGMLHLLAAGGPVTMEVRHRAKSGAVIPKEMTFSLVDSGETRLVFGSGHDISERKRQEAVLRSLLDETAAVTGQEFFTALTSQLVSVLNVHAAFLGEYLGSHPTRVRPLSVSDNQGSPEPEEFPLNLSPGRDIPDNGFLLVPKGLLERYPQGPYIGEQRIESYLGVPLHDALGAKIGHLSVMSRQPMPNDPLLVSTLRLFAQRAAAELERLRAERDLRASLREKEVLLKEIHHRVKNNMQIVSSLLSLQARDVEDPAVLDLLAQSRARILSMALVHEDLYQTGNLAHVDFRHYLERLADRVRSGIAGASGVRFELDLDELNLAVDQAIPLGLLCNELFTNALKHAFVPGLPGCVRVSLRRQPGLAVITVRDDGKGLPADFRPAEGSTLGLQLVWSLAEQLQGQAEAHTDAGAVFTIRFPVD